MGRRYRRWRDEREGRDGFDDVVSSVTDAIDTISESVSAVNDPSERERRRQAKEEKRRREEASSRRTMMGAGAGLLAGGLAASMGLITVAAVGVGILAGGLVVFALREVQERPEYTRHRAFAREAQRPALEDPTIAGQDARTALVRSVVTTAMGYLRTVDKVAAASADLETSAILTRIAAIGHRVCHAVAAQPAVFDKAQRLLTYHAEKAAKLAELSASAVGERQAGVRRVLGRMELLFEETEAALKHEDARELDLELRLIDQALDEDLRR